MIGLSRRSWSWSSGLGPGPGPGRSRSWSRCFKFERPEEKTGCPIHKMEHITAIQELVDEHKQEMPTGVAAALMQKCQQAYDTMWAVGADRDRGDITIREPRRMTEHCTVLRMLTTSSTL
eukprot:6355965-Prymnesium_polylepis.1